MEQAGRLHDNTQPEAHDGHVVDTPERDASKQPQPQPHDQDEPTAQDAVDAVVQVQEQQRRPTRCPFANLKQPIQPGAKVGCPFHSHSAPKAFHLKQPVALNVAGRTHYTSEATARLLADIGGGDRIREFCTRFYANFFADPVLVQFIFERDGAEAHGQRLADWIIQKMDEDQKPWSDSGRWGMRQPSHYRAWTNSARNPAVRGDHFKLDDTRLWMRLHFWALRETGLGPQQHAVFWNWYKQFIGHFIRVYERSAPAYVDDSADWSSDPTNIKEYLKNGRRMLDVIRPRPGYDV
jgi:hypothetical protein